MKTMQYSDAVDDALTRAMEQDPTIMLMGEDLPAFRLPLFTRFGPDRVLAAPISEGAFVGAATAAAMAGLRPVVELWMVDFVTVALDALVNHAAKVSVFSGGRWKAPMMLRAPCGGGYGDGGQHEQSLWGWLAHIPGLSVVVPSIPADAGGLMLAALQQDGPVAFLEPKLLSQRHLEYLCTGGRSNLSLDIPASGAAGPVPRTWKPIPLGSASVRREGVDITLISLGLGVHHCLQAAERLQSSGISATVVDLRTISPLDEATILSSVARTGRMLVVDEDYQRFGLSGELAAVVLEAGLRVSYSRVCTQETIPFARSLERAVLPNPERIVAAAMDLLQGADG